MLSMRPGLRMAASTMSGLLVAATTSTLALLTFTCPPAGVEGLWSRRIYTCTLYSEYDLHVCANECVHMGVCISACV